MDQFSQPVLSKKLLTIIANSTTSTNQILFKRAIASSDKYKLDDLSGFDDTSISTIKKASETVFSNVTIDRNGIQLTAIFSSNGNDSNYDINTILFTAEYGGQEFLAFSQIANYSLTVPAGSAKEVFNLTLKPKIIIDSVKNISTTVNPSGVATNEYVDSHNSELQKMIDQGDDERKNILTKFSDYILKSGNPQTVDTKLTFTEKINGTTTRADALATPRTINGVTFDGTADISVNQVVHSIKSTGIDLYNLDNGTYYVYPDTTNYTLASNRPDGVNPYFVVSVYTTGINGYMFLVDTKGDAYWTTRDDHKWKNWKQTVDTTTEINLATSATKLVTPRNIGGVAFDGTADIALPGVNATGNQNTTGLANAVQSLEITNGTDLSTIKGYGGSAVYHIASGITLTSTPSDYSGKGAILKVTESGTTVYQELIDVVTDNGAWIRIIDGSTVNDWQTKGGGGWLLKEADIPNPKFVAALYTPDTNKFTVNFSNMHVYTTSTTVRLTGSVSIYGDSWNAVDNTLGYSVDINNLLAKGSLKSGKIGLAASSGASITLDTVTKSGNQIINSTHVSRFEFNGPNFFISINGTSNYGAWSSGDIPIDITVTYS